MDLARWTWIAAAVVAAGCGGAAAERGGTAAQMPAPVPAAAQDAPIADGTGSEGALGDAPGGATDATGATDPAIGPASPGIAAPITRTGGASAETNGALAVAERGEAAPLLVYTATIGMEVEQARAVAAIEEIIESAVAAGGYLAGRSDRSVTVRVPSRAFRAGLAAIEQVGRITSRQVTADDVSAEFHDLEVRLVNLRALRARFQELLGRASTLEEILRVEAELERLAREIDGIEGRLRFLRSRIAFSVITVNLTVPPPPVVIALAPPPPPAPPAPPPPRRLLSLPIPWLAGLGVETLVDMRDPS